MAEGMSLRSVCRASNMPAKSSFLKFVGENAVASEMYARAVEARADAHFEEILAIADDPNLKTADQIRRAKLRIEARQWTVVRMNPRKYSERLHLRHGGDPDAPPVKTDGVVEHQVPAGLMNVYEKVGSLFALGRTLVPDGKPKPDAPAENAPEAGLGADETTLPAGSQIKAGKLVIPI